MINLKENFKKHYWKEWKWYYHFILFLILSISMIIGMYYAIFKEFWYANKKDPYVQWHNFEILMSFLSVQVNIITIVWLFFYLISFNKKSKHFINNQLRTIVLNWNLLMFSIFWIGVISQIGILLSQATIAQIICTTITHFIIPMFLIFIYFFEAGNKKCSIKSIHKESTFYWTLSYPSLYLIFILIRGFVFKPYWWPWPYPFLNLDHLFFTNSIILYLFILVLIFVVWFLINHLMLILINNLLFDKKSKINSLIYNQDL